MDRKPTRVGREVYPRPEHRFSNAKIGMTHHDSEPDFPVPVEAPDGAPNVVVVLLDDIGYGWPSVCGGLVRMPAAESLARDGLTYCQFHTTALCAPTRAALLTGRNHHSAARDPGGILSCRLAAARPALEHEPVPPGSRAAEW